MAADARQRQSDERVTSRSGTQVGLGRREVTEPARPRLSVARMVMLTSLMTLARSLAVERAAILHVDDIGMCHGANRGFLDLAERGFVTCGSVMVPCPWFREIAEAAAADPALDLGVHLTWTSEWEHYGWVPISTVSRASGLIADDGFFWRDAASLPRHLVPEAARAARA